MAIWEFDRLVQRASVLAFHGHQFDRLMLKAEHLRLGVPHHFRRAQRVCTMMASTKPCAIPSPNGRGGSKWPKLTEALKILMNREHVDAHGAMPDALACKDLFFHLLAAKLVTL